MTLGAAGKAPEEAKTPRRSCVGRRLTVRMYRLKFFQAAEAAPRVADYLLEVSIETRVHGGMAWPASVPVRWLCPRRFCLKVDYLGVAF